MCQNTIFCDSFAITNNTVNNSKGNLLTYIYKNNIICDCEIIIISYRFVGQQGHDIAHPGVAPIKMNGREPVYHKYYQVRPAPCNSAPGFFICGYDFQWVCFVLFFQAGLFYVPRYLWKATEGGRVNMLAAVRLSSC